MTAQSRSILEIRAAKDSLITPAAFVNFLASLKSTIKTSVLKKLLGELETITLELACLDQTISFIITCPIPLEPLIKSQIAAQYPDAIITSMGDYLPSWLSYGYKAVTQLSLSAPFYLPLNTYKDTAIDPLTSVLGVLSKLSPHQAAIIQYCLSASPPGWYKSARSIIQKGISKSADKVEAHPQKSLIEQKIAQPAFDVDIRIAAIAPDKATASALLSQVTTSFGVY